MKKQFAISISLRLVTYISVVILLICTFVTMFASVISRNILRDEANETLTEIAKQASGIVSAKVEASFNNLKILLKNSLFLNPEENKQEIIDLLEGQVDKDGCLDMTVIDKSGNSFSVKDKDRNLADTEYFKKAIRGEKCVTDPFFRPGETEKVIIYAYPFINEDNEVIGVLTATKKASELSNMIKDVNYKTGNTFIISNAYVTIAHTLADKISENIVEKANADPSLSGLAEIEKKMVAENNGVGEYKANGETKFIAYAKVAGTSWSLAIDVPESDVTQRVTDLEFGLIYIGVAGLALGMFSSVFIARNIKRPIKKLVEVSEHYAKGRFNVDINLRRKDEFGRLASKLQAASDNMNILISNIRSASRQVASGAKQVSDSSMILSQGAAEQASSLEELSSTIEEISTQTKLNAEFAENANKISSETQRNAKLGTNQMNLMLDAMEEINNSSYSISKIIKVIDDIAFQTNILALNAAIEAARAGQAGKGFAVVADEVRNLAAKSAEAAQETSDLIEGSIGKIHDGVKIAKETADYLSKIVNDVSRVAELVNNISIASSEQASGIAQVNQGILEVSRVVQENSSTSEESAAASEQLSGQAALLDEQIAKFKLKENFNRNQALNIDMDDDDKGDDAEKKAKRAKKDNGGKKSIAQVIKRLLPKSKTSEKETSAGAIKKDSAETEDAVEESVVEDMINEALKAGEAEPDAKKDAENDATLSDNEFAKY